MNTLYYGGSTILLTDTTDTHTMTRLLIFNHFFFYQLHGFKCSGSIFKQHIKFSIPASFLINNIFIQKTKELENFTFTNCKQHIHTLTNISKFIFILHQAHHIGAFMEHNYKTHLLIIQPHSHLLITHTQQPSCMFLFIPSFSTSKIIHRISVILLGL